MALTGRTPARALWVRKTSNLFRGVIEIDCTASNPADIEDSVRSCVVKEYSPGALVPFAFGAILHFASSAPAPSPQDLMPLIADRAQSRGTWQWLIVVDAQSQRVFGVHMWAKGYLTDVYEGLLQHFDAVGESHIKQPSKFWRSLWSAMKSLGTARKVLTALALVLASALALGKLLGWA